MEREGAPGIEDGRGPPEAGSAFIGEIGHQVVCRYVPVARSEHKLPRTLAHEGNDGSKASELRRCVFASTFPCHLKPTAVSWCEAVRQSQGALMSDPAFCGGFLEFLAVRDCFDQRRARRGMVVQDVVPGDRFLVVLQQVRLQRWRVQRHGAPRNAPEAAAWPLLQGGLQWVREWRGEE